MSTKEDMFLKQYKFVGIVEGAKLSELDNKVADVIKEIGLASSDDIVEKFIPNYKDNLHPNNVNSRSMKQRMSAANELRKIAVKVMQIDGSLKKLIKIGCVSQIKS